MSRSFVGSSMTSTFAVRANKRASSRRLRSPPDSAFTGEFARCDNQLRGIVEEVRSDGLLSQVRLRIGDQLLTAVITRDAVNELKLKRGDEAVAIVKSTEVMIGRTSTERPARRRRLP